MNVAAFLVFLIFFILLGLFGVAITVIRIQQHERFLKRIARIDAELAEIRSRKAAVRK